MWFVVAVGPGHFIAGDAVAEMDFRGQPGVAEQLERTVDRGLSDARIAPQNILIELFQRMVAGEFKKRFGNDASLGCGVQPLAAHEVQEVRQGRVVLFGHNQPP